MAHLSVQSVPSSRCPLGSHVCPGDDEDAGRLHAVVSGESFLDMLMGSPQNIWAALLPEEDLPSSVTVVQVSQQGCDHSETSRHLPQVLPLTGRLDNSHKSISVNLQQEVEVLAAVTRQTSHKLTQTSDFQVRKHLYCVIIMT